MLSGNVCLLRNLIEQALHRLRVRTGQMKVRSCSCRREDIRLDCWVPPEQTWEETLYTLKVAADENLPKGLPLKASKVLKCAEHLQETNAMSVVEILHCIGFTPKEADDDRLIGRVVQQLLRALPVLPFEDLVLLGEPIPDSGAEDTPIEDTTQEPVYSYLPRQRPRQKPLYQQFPDIVTLVTDFLQAHGFAAEARRRSCIGNAMGVTLAGIQEHLKAKIPQLKERGISRTTIHELLVAPRKGTRNAKRYHGLVAAKVPGKDNSLRKRHIDSHFAFAQINYVVEFSSMFESDCAVLSCDDMNKVNVGSLAVSRYHQIGKFFPVDDTSLQGPRFSLSKF